ncbi:MAG: hypothetical protein EOP45_23605 [Sphingobacteriaceae bacterium]|nr:MAG: hypothetical protein EOP45_23605 [Sphingobacteriaceae bacterium]
MSNRAVTVEAKHIFLDIVNYTYGRSIEAQTELIIILNKIVRLSIRKGNIKSENVIYIPTGDGMCISIINKHNPYDIHLSTAIDILRQLYEHNKSTEDEMRRFILRIGINENYDNLIVDINKQKNISGSGINFAARILTLCDANQILISNTVFDKLVQREKYLQSFKNYVGEVKHGVKLSVYQYKNHDLHFLNNNIPIAFAPRISPTIKLNELVAYYLSNCIIHEDFIINNLHQTRGQYSLTYLLFHLAEDDLEKSKVTKTKPRPYIETSSNT